MGNTGRTMNRSDDRSPRPDREHPVAIPPPTSRVRRTALVTIFQEHTNHRSSRQNRPGDFFALRPGPGRCHAFRPAGITAYLENGNTLEGDQPVAGYLGASTTELYDRRKELASKEEKIGI